MNNDLTLNALTYTWKYSDKEGSERRNAGLGANLPRILKIAHQETFEGTEKLPSLRSVIRHDQYVVDGDGNPLPVPVSLYLVQVVPDAADPAAVTTAISDSKIAIRQMISPTGADAGALDLFNEVFVTQAQ
jgi:hypothetical protein